METYRRSWYVSWNLTMHVRCTVTVHELLLFVQKQLHACVLRPRDPFKTMRQAMQPARGSSYLHGRSR